jgi:hypothetical protein
LCEGAGRGLPADQRILTCSTRKNLQGVHVLEEALDNRPARYWAILQVNRVVSDGKRLDFVVFAGDLGLENVRLNRIPAHPVRCKCPIHRRPPKRIFRRMDGRSSTRDRSRSLFFDNNALFRD